jgi:nicotinic acid mononucleotide adenylyltransferase
MCHIGKKRMKLFLFFIFLKNMKDAILVIGGSFNPVHTQHISLLCLAKQELENTGEWNIIGGYLAVAPDNYVRHKLHLRNERTIKLKHRLELINEAIKDIPWLVNSPCQEMLKQHESSAFGLGQRIKRLLQNDNIHILILIGGDRMVKKNVPIWRKSSKNDTSVTRVGIGRIMDENINLFKFWQEDLEKNLIPNPKEFIILNISLQSVSSSLVRIDLNRWFNSNDEEQKIEIENDLINKKSYLHSNVMDYIKKNQNDLYINI